MNQVNKILIAALAVQLGLMFVTFRTEPNTTIARAKKVLPGFNAAGVTRVAIYDAPKKSNKDAKAKAKADEKPAVVLVKSGKKWAVASSAGYAADNTKVSDFLSTIAEMHTRTPLATSKTRHKQLKVAPDDYRRKIVLTGGVGGKAAKTTLYVGIFAGRGKVAMRIAGHNETQAVSSDLSLNASTKMTGWVDTTYFKVTSNQVTEMEIENATGTFSLIRSGSSWSVSSPPSPKKGAKPQTSMISTIARELSTIRLADAAGKTMKPEYGLKSPTATVTLTVTPPPPQTPPDAGAASTTSASPQSYTILIGAKADNKVYVKEASNPYIVQVQSSSLKKVLNLTPQTLYGIGTAKKSAKPGTQPGVHALPVHGHGMMVPSRPAGPRPNKRAGKIVHPVKARPKAHKPLVHKPAAKAKPTKAPAKKHPATP